MLCSKYKSESRGASVGTIEDVVKEKEERPRDSRGEIHIRQRRVQNGLQNTKSAVSRGKSTQKSGSIPE